MRKSFPKNFVSRRYRSLLVRTQIVWRTATSIDIAIVIGTKRKW